MSIYTEKISQATLPVIGLPDFVIFPFITANITIDNKNLLRVIREANRGKKEIVIATATEDTESLSYDKVYHTATVAVIKQITPDKESKGAFSVIVEGVSRATINEVLYLGKVSYARVEIKEIHEENEKKDEAAFRIIKKLM
ncbi:MAG: LON peptidase substrate-binding domain-containing protein, partial [Clostridia bacterium]|nr:LON peptidase substrate-binding domain-containing protein [Clostridia bacterium]